jgi:fatty acid/phospholipid biosynthesis enzyme
MGTKAPVVKAHGSSDAQAIKNALLVAAKGVDKELTKASEGVISS